MSAHRPFSAKWAFISMVVFVVTEAALAWFVGEYLVGQYLTQPGDFRVQGMLYLLSYLVGGFIVGVISPGVRIMEPAIGAFFSAAASLVLALFMPLSFFRLSTWKLVVGGLIAFFLALWGAQIGERLSGHRLDEDAQLY